MDTLMDTLKSKKVSRETTIRGDIAIIGMACTFSKAPDLSTFWQNILSGVDAVRDVPPGRWDTGIHFSEDGSDINKVYCKRGGYLDGFMTFDPVKHGVMPLGVEGGEPDQFLVLETVHEALKDAGYLDGGLESRRTEFILGRGGYPGVAFSNLFQRSIFIEQGLNMLQNLHPEYSAEEIAQIREELLSCLPKLSAETAVSCIPNLATGRSANRLDFMGPNYTIDAACASSLIATEIGVRDLLTGKCDLAITGGVHIFTQIPFLLVFCAIQALSRRSEIRPFDKDADGIIPGEGIGIVVLKRQEDAERDNDRIYAVIKGVGSSSDGRAVSVTAPRVEGEELALRQAYEIAGISPRTIRLIEAHGTGTPVGDVVEIEAMRRIFGSQDELGPQCALGSVKSMIGHTMAAAGVAGIIKAALSLYHKTLPPTLHCQEANPRLGLEKTPFYLNTETRPWIHGERDFPRRAGVNAFGFGGVNAHVILEEYITSAGESPQKTSPLFWETEVYIFHGESRQRLINQMHDVRKYVNENPALLLRDLAFSLNTTLNGCPYRLAIVASSVDDLQQKLAYALEKIFNPECHHIKDLRGIYFFESPLYKKGKLAFLFPGEGAQYLNMLSDLCLAFPEIRSCFDKADQIFIEKGQKDMPSHSIFPPPFFSQEKRRAAEKNLLRVDQSINAIVIGNYAMFSLLRTLGLKPDQVAGHSAGEWSAITFSGIINQEEFIQNYYKLNNIYLKLVQDPHIPKAIPLAVATNREQIALIIEQLEGTMYLANDNCPHQVVITGEEEVADKAGKLLLSKGILFRQLPFDRGYHTPLCRPICPHLREYFSNFSISSPQTEVYSCNTMSPYPEDPEKILKLAAETWVLPVAFRQTIENMYESGTRIFVEVGPKGNLTAFVEDILRGRPHLTVASNMSNRSGITQINHLVGLLSAEGFPLNLDYLYQYRSPSFISWTERKKSDRQGGREIKMPLGYYSLKVKKRHIDRKSGNMPDMSMFEEIDKVIGDYPKTHSHVFSSSVAEYYFQIMDYFLDTQKEIMQAHLERLHDPLTTDQIPTRLEEPVGVSEPPLASDYSNQTKAASTPPAGVTDEDLTQILVELVSERTGYPKDMIGLNLDMEADLGIDSIKRVEIIGSLRKKFDRIKEEEAEVITGFKTLQQVIDFFKERLKDSSGCGEPFSEHQEATPAGLPFIGKVEYLKQGKEVAVLRQIDLKEDLLLDDHRLGWEISTLDPSLGGLPVIPLTVSIEMMAEVASLLFPGQKLVCIERALARQWIFVEEENPITLRIKARALSQGEAMVQIQNLGKKGTTPGDQKPAVTGRMHFASNYSASPSCSEFVPDEERTPAHTAEQVYSEHCMFHGPSFHGIFSMDKIGKNGLKAHLQTLPKNNLFFSSPEPNLLIDPCLLDSSAQLVGYWPLEYLDRGFITFPTGLQSLHIYGDTPPPFSCLKAQMKLREVTNNLILADVDIFGEDGRLWLQFSGWQDWRFYWSKELFDFGRFPNTSTVSQPWNPPVQLASDQEKAPVFMLFQQPWQNFDMLSQHIIAYYFLSRKERTIYQTLPDASIQKNWLIERMMAKEVIRSFIRKYSQQNLYPTDIIMIDDEYGHPHLDKSFSEGPWPIPLFSVAYADDIAIAMAVKGGAFPGISIAKIQLSSLSMKIIVSPDEEALLSPLDQPMREEWIIRFYCARESAAKALNCGPIKEIKTLTIHAFDMQTGEVKISTEGGSQLNKSLIKAYTVREKEYIISITIIEE